MGCNTSHEKTTPQAEEENAENEVNNEIANANDQLSSEVKLKDNIKACSKKDVSATDEVAPKDGKVNGISHSDVETKPDTVNKKKKEEVIAVNGETKPHENGIEAADDEEEAAVKIQAAFRGHKVRATMKQGDNNSSSASAAAKQPETQQDDPTKQELEAEFDRNDKDLCNAATRIQATFRGHMARKVAVGEPVKDEKDLHELTKKVAEELDIDMNDPELNKAAVKIQASFRGHKVRKDQTDH